MVLFGSLAKGGSASVTVNADRSALVVAALVDEEEPVEA
jgi:hypothetical protein